MLRSLLGLALALGIAAGALTSAWAQELGCDERRVSGPARKVLSCAGGLMLDAEAAAVIGVAADATGPRELKLDSGGVLVEAPPGSSFQILTPHAIASVRGTAFIVDVQEGVTSVFVMEGIVGVEHRFIGGEAVVLEHGDGVDVSPNEPLVVKRWGQERMDRIMARFAR